MSLKSKLIAVVLLCAALSMISAQLQALPMDECETREDHCSIIEAIRTTKEIEHRIYGVSVAYKWYYNQSNAAYTSGDPALCKHTHKCN